MLDYDFMSDTSPQRWCVLRYFLGQTLECFFKPERGHIKNPGYLLNEVYTHSTQIKNPDGTEKVTAK